jgi:glycerate 2-kinase
MVRRRPVTAVPDDLEAIFRAGLERANPVGLVRDQLSLRGDTLTVGSGAERFSLDLGGYRKVLVLGAGKASARMASAVEEILGPRLVGGVVAVKHGHGERLERCTLVEAGHPVPDEDSVRAAEQVARTASAADERCLIIGLVSGGASAILCLPQGITLEEKRAVTRELLGCGATIHEINTVRKHLSGIKGGRLARLIYPATSANLILSDVVGDDLDVIASGLTAPDASTYAQALEVLRARGIQDRIPRAALDVLESGAQGRLPESPKPGDAIFQRCRNVVVGSLHKSALAAADRARELGYNTLLLTTRLQGEARDAAGLLLGLARDVAASGIPVSPPACIITGGETTVTLRGRGSGGRNQELALAFLAGLGKVEMDGRAWLLSASTDGSDGPTDAAGAFGSQEILNAAQRMGLNPAAHLAENDSYAFFSRAGGLFKTGPTGTNVCDMQVLVVR